ncbi:DUF4276 family protein [Desulfosoma caldarium]|uniref:Uncharacterized protein DUF4276 n=1 Tax=Desulfosoma caldarium TaxID=610254 RepID=A0A3N1UI20_9BACT|nr:DUF4276 family protein [Desulfosoma caldarium]ROQ90902.1 uncharacterized protein DUF4276 [Desulfosoma caldarium]
MSEPLIIDLFVEDRAHEEFLKPLLFRIAAEEQVAVKVRVRSARGGHARAGKELQLFLRLIQKGVEECPDLFVVGIDGNCERFTKKRDQIATATGEAIPAKVIAACPDPHVECWYLADPDSFQQVVGYRPTVGKTKCARDHYKTILANAVRQGGYPPTLGGIEFAAELVTAMDLYRASKNDPSLKAFLGDLRAKLRQAKRRDE